MSKAQLAVDRLPGYGTLASDGARNIAQAARKLVVGLVEVRNVAGTGHGRVASPALDEPDAVFLADAALLWCRWILQRLDIVAASSPVKLIADLRSQVFYKGVLADRLADARIDDLGEDDQRAIGLAVGQRAAGGTVVVWHDGVRAAADSADFSVWPPAYREGVAEGLLIDANGYVRPAQGTTEAALALLAQLPDGGEARLQIIESLVRQSALAYPATDEQRDQAVGVLRGAAGSSSAPHAALLSLADAIAALGR